MKNQNIRNSYQNEIESYLIDNQDQPSNNQNSWNKITKMLKQAAESTIGYVNKSRRDINEGLSLLQRSIKIQIESCINRENRAFLKIYRNRILTEIHYIIKNEENEKIKQTTAELEKMKNENNKMREAVKRIRQLRPPQKLLIKGKNGLTANPAEQSKIIAEI